MTSAGHGIFPLLIDLIHDLNVDHHELLTGAAQAVKYACLDKVLNCTLIDFPATHALDKVLQMLKLTALVPLFNDCLDHRSSHALNCSQTKTDIAVLYRKCSHTFINIRRQDLDAHLAAAVDILSHFTGIIND